jgi:hypothetical protein
MVIEVFVPVHVEMRRDSPRLFTLKIIQFDSGLIDEYFSNSSYKL